MYSSVNIFDRLFFSKINAKNAPFNGMPVLFQPTPCIFKWYFHSSGVSVMMFNFTRLRYTAQDSFDGTASCCVPEDYALFQNKRRAFQPMVILPCAVLVASFHAIYRHFHDWSLGIFAAIGGDIFISIFPSFQHMMVPFVQSNYLRYLTISFDPFKATFHQLIFNTSEWFMMLHVSSHIFGIFRDRS